MKVQINISGLKVKSNFRSSDQNNFTTQKQNSTIELHDSKSKRSLLFQMQKHI